MKHKVYPLNISIWEDYLVPHLPYQNFMLVDVYDLSIFILDESELKSDQLGALQITSFSDC